MIVNRHAVRTSHITWRYDIGMSYKTMFVTARRRSAFTDVQLILPRSFTNESFRFRYFGGTDVALGLLHNYHTLYAPLIYCATRTLDAVDYKLIQE